MSQMNVFLLMNTVAQENDRKEDEVCKPPPRFHECFTDTHIDEFQRRLLSESSMHVVQKYPVYKWLVSTTCTSKWYQTLHVNLSNE